MSGKNDSCGSDDASLTDDIAPLRKWDGPKGTGSYTDGPSHVDRADFGDDETDDAKAKAKDEPKADDDAAETP